ncbi:protein phosphatase 2C-like domain-containing protein 1 isoform X1 [Saccostrea echinata]|uniref:protein phosphatase 2C-like domain-containing protein 1 isoform X1 n=1 Tax=Saccostrea echinata TaxID=191078 RepID=UPI002A7EBC89|nr:protein phosphatase 2C-like domain-containing protein 1 isoform X1 [Saccostrea echinata]
MTSIDKETTPMFEEATEDEYSDRFDEEEEQPTHPAKGENIYRSDTPETNITELPSNPDISIRCDRCKIYINLRALHEHRVYHDALEVMKYQGKNKPTSIDGLRKRRQIILRKIREQKETPKQLQAIQELNDAYEFLKADVQGTFELERQNREEINTDVRGVAVNCSPSCVFALGMCSAQNDRWKSYMEDTKVYQDCFGDDRHKCYFGLFDGYHGRFAADMAAAELHHLLLNEMSKFDPKTKSTTATNVLDTTDVSQYSFERPDTKESERAVLHESSVDIVQQIINMCEDKYEELITPRATKSAKKDNEQKENKKKKQKAPFTVKMESALAKSYYLTDILLSYGKDERSKVRWSGCSALTVVIQGGDKMEQSGNPISPVAEEDEERKTDIYMSRPPTLENKLDQSQPASTMGFDPPREMGMIYLANAGNVHGVLVRGNRAYKLTKDHTPQNEKEKNRVIKAGADISLSEREMRVSGVVATTRGLGNHGDVVLKNSVIVEPHTMSVAVDQYCQFLLLASHGVWEVFSETEAANLLLKLLPSNFIPAPSKISTTLRPLIEESNSQANISLITQTPRRVSFSEPADDRLKMSPRASTMIDIEKNNSDEDMKTENGSHVGPYDEESGNEADVETYGDFLSLPSNSRLSNYNPSMTRDQFQRDLSRTMAEHLVQAALLAGAKNNITVMVVLLPGCGV